jgi:type I restriction enzyme, S subunit
LTRIRQFPASVDPGKPSEPPTPEGWKRVRFRDVLDVVERPVSLEPEKEYQLVTAKRSRGGIESRSKLKGSQIKVKTQFLIEEGDFLISRRQIVHGACGIVSRNLAGSIVSNEYDVLRAKPNLAIGYLVALSHTAYFQRTCFHSSVGVDIEKMVFRLQGWLDYHFPLPPLRVQRKIVSILASADETIEKTEQVIQNLEVTKGRLAKELLNGASARWETKYLGNLLISGPTSGKSPVTGNKPSGVPTFSIAAVRDGLVNIEPHLKYAEANPSDVTGFLLARGDILIIRGNANLDLVGRCGIVRSAPEGCIYPDILMRIRLKPEIETDFFVEVWNSELVRSQIIARAKTTTGTYKVNQQDLIATNVPVPSAKEQRRIAGVLLAIKRCRLGNLEFLSALRQLKSLLTNALLTGQIRITPDEALHD